MDLRTAPPPAEGRSLPFGNGGFNKALMPAQAGRLSLFNMEKGKREQKALLGRAHDGNLPSRPSNGRWRERKKSFDARA